MLGAGVPVIAVVGETIASRATASMLTGAALPELIASSLDDYRNMGLRFASDRAELARLKRRILDQRHTAVLFDTARFTRNLEKALGAIWGRHASGLPPHNIAII
jgi:predicted O-linked N-acetylglucosamine transferase (SPINDLY family)